MWYLYILKCQNGSLYVGVTDDLQRRVNEHIEGRGGRFTRLSGVTHLLYHETFSDKLAAFKRERQIKGWTRRKKLALIHGDLDLLKKL